MSGVRIPVRSGAAAVGVVALTVSVWLTVSPPAARADCTGAGDFGAGSGCAPPGGGSSSAKAWPPTSVDWPPNVDSDSGGGSGDSGESSPIVLPDGQKPSTTTSRTSAPATPTTSSTPIVPLGPP
ncbi:hypothetical protein OS122_12880 [Mycolicibacterium mucogenicum]|uniref:hypothetical protein n=1 Tax=Mycolicibacterium mucogenicum TaxID=56689 RepID=UPI00226AC227|nr:hypothetical protein [Mycolicibacterium mucogenicum]MCX8561779.1 hypothetical protein [Mycolicibacterium mucogenicum]